MAIKTIRVCDRCGKYIEYRGWTARIKGLRFRKIFMRKILNGNPDGIFGSIYAVHSKMRHAYNISYNSYYFYR